MGTRRYNQAAAALPCGKVLVAGGSQPFLALNAAELWDPMAGEWSELPPMAEARWGAGCVPKGFAECGGAGKDDPVMKLAKKLKK